MKLSEKSDAENTLRLLILLLPESSLSITFPGLRGCECHYGRKVHHQGFKTCQEEENQTGNQNSAESCRWPECCCST